jgi:hypothetical protein
MSKLKSLRVQIEDGEVLESAWTGEKLFYSALWSEVQMHAEKEAKRINCTVPTTIKAAGYALELIGIPCHYLEADMSEDDWVIYWR